MNKICLLSDTHGKLDDKIIKILNNGHDNNLVMENIKFSNVQKDISIEQYRGIKCSHIIHAGDIGNHSILDKLNQICCVTAILGNCDNNDLRLNSQELKQFEYINIEGINIAIAHQYGHLRKYVYGDAFFSPQIPEDSTPDLLVHGHIHRVQINTNSRIPVICPGAATITDRHIDTPSSLCMIYINNGKLLSGEIIQLRSFT